MQICKNCGAEFADNLMYCPFCNAEVESKAQKEHDDVINALNEEAEEWRDKEQHADTTAQKGKSLITRSAKVIILAILIFVALAAVIFEIIHKNAVPDAKEQLAKLDVYFYACDYEKLGEEIDKIKDHHDNLYHKYNDILRYENDYEDARNEVESINRHLDSETSEEYVKHSIQFAFINCFGPLFRIETRRQAGWAEGEKVPYEALESDIRALLRDEYCLEDADIDLGIEIYTEWYNQEGSSRKDIDYTVIIDKSYERMSALQ